MATFIIEDVTFGTWSLILAFKVLYLTVSFKCCLHFRATLCFANKKNYIKHVSQVSEHRMRFRHSILHSLIDRKITWIAYITFYSITILLRYCSKLELNKCCFWRKLSNRHSWKLLCCQEKTYKKRTRIFPH